MQFTPSIPSHHVLYLSFLSCYYELLKILGQNDLPNKAETTQGRKNSGRTDQGLRRPKRPGSSLFTVGSIFNHLIFQYKWKSIMIITHFSEGSDGL